MCKIVKSKYTFIGSKFFIEITNILTSNCEEKKVVFNFPQGNGRPKVLNVLI